MGKFDLVAFRGAFSVFFFASFVVIKLELQQFVVQCSLKPALLKKLLRLILLKSIHADPLTQVKA